jgi:hypothetical protein
LQWIVADRTAILPLGVIRVPYILHTPHYLSADHRQRVFAYNDICMDEILLYSLFSHTFSISFFIHPDSKTQRSQGRQAQLGNINAARAVADIIRSTLGPRSMLKVRITMTAV